MEPNKTRKEEIYLCKNCSFPLSNSSIEKKIFQIYGDNVFKNVLDEKLNLDIYRCLLATQINDNSYEKDYNYGIDEKKNIFCRNCKHILGFLIEFDKKIIGYPLKLGLVDIGEIEINNKSKFREYNEVEFKNKKEKIEVVSQAQYTVLAKLKQLRYYVKQLSPILKDSMGNISKEKSIIDECDDKFDKYKLNLVFNKIEKIEKEKEQKEVINIEED